MDKFAREESSDENLDSGKVSSTSGLNWPEAIAAIAVVAIVAAALTLMVIFS